MYLVFYIAAMIYLKNILQKLRKYKLVVAFAIIGLVSFKATDTYFEISKNMDLFVSVFKEINTYYVDEIDAGKLTKRDIDEMLNTEKAVMDDGQAGVILTSLCMN